MFIPEFDIECELLQYCCMKDGEIEIASDELRHVISQKLDMEILHIFFAPDADFAPVSIVVECETYWDEDPFSCFPVVLNDEERDHFHIDTWQEYIP